MKVSPPTVLSLIAVFIALGGLGYAAVSSTFPDSGGTFHACVTTKTGALRLVPKGRRCRRGQRLVDWAQRGIPGPRGQDGAKGADGAQGVAGVPGVPGQTGATGQAGTTVILRARNGASGSGGGDGGGGGSNTVITSTTSAVPVSLTSTSFSQTPGQDAFVHGSVTVDVPAAGACQTAGPAPGTLTVEVALDGLPAGQVVALAGSTPSPRTIPIGWRVGNTDSGPFASGVYPFIGMNVAQNHAISATVADDCTVPGATHFSISLLKLEIIGAG